MANPTSSAPEPVGRFHEFTLDEALAIAKRNDPGEKVPSVSRVLIAELDRLATAHAAQAAEMDDLRQRLASVEERAALNARMLIEELTRNAHLDDKLEAAEQRAARCKQLLRRCANALRIGECDMHYHLPSGHRVSLLDQLDAALAATTEKNDG